MLRFTQQDIDRMQGLLAHLHAPLEASDPEEWRLEANRRLEALLGAETINLTVPFRWMRPSGLLGVDPRAADEYFGYFAERDPGPAARKALGLDICSQRFIYSSDLPKTELYNDFFLPHRLVGGVVMNADLPDGTFAFMSASGAEGDPDRERRWMGVMRLLLPAFQAGVRTLWSIGEHRADLVSMVDRLSVGVALYPAAELTPMHVNPRLREMLEADNDSSAIRQAMNVAARTTARAVAGASPLGQALSPAVQDLVTSGGAYSIHGTPLGFRGAGRERLVLVVVERTRRALPDAEMVRRRFGLTPRESEVALLIASGLTDRQIAERLTVSWHTARTHSERALQKLGASTRAEVATRLVSA